MSAVDLSFPVLSSTASSDSVLKMRAEAQGLLEELGMPSIKLEDWSFSNLKPFLKRISTFPWCDAAIAFQNADVIRTAPDYMLERLNDFDRAQSSLKMVTTSFVDGVYFIDIPPKSELSDPILIEWMLKDTQSAHVFIRIGAHSHVTILENQNGDTGFRVGYMSVDAGQNATVHHVRIMNDHADSIALQKLDICTDRDSSYHGFILNKGGAFSRTEICGRIVGENAEIHCNGVQLQNLKQVADTTILIEHEAPHGRSHQFYKSVLAGESTGVFQGKIHVHREAQKTDGYQMSNGILLSSGASMHTKPQLEIYADDVKCSHGTTTGQMDETPLFYLCSRGIEENEARRLLLRAAIADVVDTIRDDDIQSSVLTQVDAWLDELYG